MDNTTTTEETFIDCRGLSDALTLLRLKQAVIGFSGGKRRVDAVVDHSCDDARIASILSDGAGELHFLKTEENAPPAYMVSMSTLKSKRPHV